MPERSHLLLYDGVCGLCNRLIQFILPRDPEGIFEFAPLQSGVGRELVTKFGRDPDVLTTFYVIVDHRGENPRLLSRAEAGLFLLKVLGRPWSWMAVLGLLPDGLLDRGYDMIARNRYSLFGRYDKCLIPSPDYGRRFIDR